MRVISRLTLDRVVENVFAETEQAASLELLIGPSSRDEVLRRAPFTVVD